MIVDTSAILAIILMEQEADRFASKIAEVDSVAISAANWFESSIVLARRGRQGVTDRFDSLLIESRIAIEPVTVAQALIARTAYARFGKGNHPAALNFGDCFAYALAKSKRRPLLFKGNDFQQTDIPSALEQV